MSPKIVQPALLGSSSCFDWRQIYNGNFTHDADSPISYFFALSIFFLNMLIHKKELNAHFSPLTLTPSNRLLVTPLNTCGIFPLSCNAGSPPTTLCLLIGQHLPAHLDRNVGTFISKCFCFRCVSLLHPPRLPPGFWVGVQLSSLAADTCRITLSGFGGWQPSNACCRRIWPFSALW